MTKIIKEIEEEYGTLTERRLSNEWKHKRYVNKDVVKYVLTHRDDKTSTPLLQAVVNRKDSCGHSTGTTAWSSVKLSDITVYAEDRWERRIKDVLSGLGSEIDGIYEEDRRLVRNGIRSAYGFFVYSEQARKAADEVAWEIAGIKANGLLEEESE